MNVYMCVCVGVCVWHDGQAYLSESQEKTARVKNAGHSQSQGAASHDVTSFYL